MRRPFTDVHGLPMAGRCGVWIEAFGCLRLATAAELASVAPPDEPRELAIAVGGLTSWLLRAPWVRR